MAARLPRASAAANSLVIGTFVSPFVRKVLAVLNIKRVPYHVDPLVPFFGNDAFEKISPLRRVPVLIDDAVAVADSSVIVQYLEERYPLPSVLPASLADRARCRFLEEYADTAVANVLVFKIWFQRAVAPSVFGVRRDDELIRRAVETELPPIMDFLEVEAAAAKGKFRFGDELSLADIAIASCFRTMELSRAHVDLSRWPLTQAWLQRVQAHEALAPLAPFELICASKRPSEQRAALLAAGAPVLPGESPFQSAQARPSTRVQTQSRL